MVSIPLYSFGQTILILCFLGCRGCESYPRYTCRPLRAHQKHPQTTRVLYHNPTSNCGDGGLGRENSDRSAVHRRDCDKENYVKLVGERDLEDTMKRPH